MLALATQADGTRVLVLSLEMADLDALVGGHGVTILIPAQHQDELALDKMTVIPCEDGDFVELVVKLETGQSGPLTAC
jgi:hypothetical protein